MPADQPVQRLKAKEIIEGRVLVRTQLHFLGRARIRDLENLHTGIFFIFAWWSAPSHIALDHLAKAILMADPAGMLELFVADADGISELSECDLLRGKLHGNGESVWKRESRVVDTLFRVGQISDYESRIIQLLGQNSSN
jgi:hypothetical protein